MGKKSLEFWKAFDEIRPSRMLGPKRMSKKSMNFSFFSIPWDFFNSQLF